MRDFRTISQREQAASFLVLEHYRHSLQVTFVIPGAMSSCASLNRASLPHLLQVQYHSRSGMIAMDAEPGAGPNDEERRSGVSCIRSSVAALLVIGQLGRWA